ncbi:PadR family transcriptional regulator [Polymorphospora rubra]|uniref:PadR family transcriptional regulator n=1 Tax=Polymorphospora rubra TaxID=338584 RepID=UPI0033DDB7EB
MRITVTMARVLSALLEEQEADRYGLDLMKVTGLTSGSLYPILRRLEQAGWLLARWEEIDAVAAGRPARRYYRLTAHGIERAGAALAELHAATTPRPKGVPAPDAHLRARPAW